MKVKKNSRRNYAALGFIIAFIFFGIEVFAVCTAKNQYDYSRAKESAEELSVELGLVSSALDSGNRKLYDDSLSRYRATLSTFSENEYSYRHQAELIKQLRDYNNKLKDSEPEIAEFMELSAALSGLNSELFNADSDKLDAVNFYHIQETFQHLRESLDKMKSEKLTPLKTKLDDFAKDIISLTESSAICISVCPKSSFEGKRDKLKEIKERYAKELNELSKKASEDYNPSEIIIRLGEI